jgi:hypothetical protein
MNAGEDRPDLSTEAFLAKWMPQTLSAKARSDFLMDLERLVLARTLESTGTIKQGPGEAADFDWSDHESVTIPRVGALAVYKSDEGDIVIRQERPSGEEDAVVVIPLTLAPSVIEAIQRQFIGPALQPVLSRRPER